MTLSITTFCIECHSAFVSVAIYLWLCLLTIFWMSLCWVSLCWVSLCWVSLFSVSLCWMLWPHTDQQVSCSDSFGSQNIDIIVYTEREHGWDKFPAWLHYMIGLLDFYSTFKYYLLLITNMLAFGHQLMLLPHQRIKCMQCPGSTCLLSICVNYDVYGTYWLNTAAKHSTIDN
jgi:hypothetical protein